MKRILVVYLATVLSIFFTSCKKYYSCTCTHDGQVYLLMKFEDTKKKKVKEYCQLEEDYQNANNYAAECEVEKLDHR